MITISCTRAIYSHGWFNSAGLACQSFGINKCSAQSLLGNIKKWFNEGQIFHLLPLRGC